MNSNPDQSASSLHLKRRYYSGAFIAVLCLIAAGALWSNHSRTQRDKREQATRNEQLENALSAVRAELAEARKELDFFKTGDSLAAVTKKTVQAKPTNTKPAEEPETLFLQEPSVSQADSGLAVRFEFQPESNVELPDLVTLVVRIPSNSDAKILSLKPVDTLGYSNVEFLVNPTGNLGMIEGAPSDLKALEFELIVSEPITATVRGSKGIKAFEMDIAAEGCTVRKL